MEDQIVKFRDNVHDGYVERYIFGLNLLPDDHPKLGSRSDPRLIFLREISRRHYAAGLINKQADRVDRLDLLVDVSGVDVANSVVRGDLVGPGHSSDSTGLFFSKVKPRMFDLEEIEADGHSEAVIFHILYCDGLCLFVSSTSEDSTQHLFELLNGPIITTDLHNALDLFDLILTSHADGDFFHCLAKDRSTFELVQSSLEIAVTAIKDLQWYQRSKNDLVWDEEYSMCLVEKG